MKRRPNSSRLEMRGSQIVVMRALVAVRAAEAYDVPREPAPITRIFGGWERWARGGAVRREGVDMVGGWVMVVVER